MCEIDPETGKKYCCKGICQDPNGSEKEPATLKRDSIQVSRQLRFWWEDIYSVI